MFDSVSSQKVSAQKVSGHKVLPKLIRLIQSNIAMKLNRWLKQFHWLQCLFRIRTFRYIGLGYV